MTKESKREELKQCPFCGSFEAYENYTSFGDSNKIDYTVECENCPADIGWHDTLEEAVKSWNTRTTNESMVKALEEIDNLIIHKYQYNFNEYFGDDIREDIEKIKSILLGETKGGV